MRTWSTMRESCLAALRSCCSTASSSSTCSVRSRCSACSLSSSPSRSSGRRPDRCAAPKAPRLWLSTPTRARPVLRWCSYRAGSARGDSCATRSSSDGWGGGPRTPNTSRRSAQDQACSRQPACSMATGPRRTRESSPGPASRGPPCSGCPEARWSQDRDRWTSSGVAAGMDMALALIAHLHRDRVAAAVADGVEYEWHQDSNWDPFAAKNGLTSG